MQNRIICKVFSKINTLLYRVSKAHNSYYYLIILLLNTLLIVVLNLIVNKIWLDKVNLKA